jgi:hypothetical protein
MNGIAVGLLEEGWMEVAISLLGCVVLLADREESDSTSSTLISTLGLNVGAGSLGIISSTGPVALWLYDTTFC